MSTAAIRKVEPPLVVTAAHAPIEARANIRVSPFNIQVNPSNAESWQVDLDGDDPLRPIYLVSDYDRALLFATSQFRTVVIHERPAALFEQPATTRHALPAGELPRVLELAGDAPEREAVTFQHNADGSLRVWIDGGEDGDSEAGFFNVSAERKFSADEVARLVAFLTGQPPARRIVAVAIKQAGVIAFVPRPGRHHDVIRNLAAEGLPPQIIGEQGFLTDDGLFVDRGEALAIARAAGQLVRKTEPAHELFSEDLW